MSDVATLLRTAKESGDFAALAAMVPYTAFLGISAEVHAEELVGKLAFSAQLVGNPAVPALHGGGIGSLLECTAIFEILWSLEVLGVPKTISVTVDYLRPGRLEDTFAVGRITKQGRRVVNVAVEAWQSDRARLIATANVHFLVQTAR